MTNEILYRVAATNRFATGKLGLYNYESDNEIVLTHVDEEIRYGKEQVTKVERNQIVNMLLDIEKDIHNNGDPKDRLYESLHDSLTELEDKYSKMTYEDLTYLLYDLATLNFEA